MNDRNPSSAMYPEPDVEDELLGKWFPRIGALAFVLGAGFGFKYAVDQGWVDVRLRVMLGLLASSILIAVGDWSRKQGWSPYASAITGGGIGLLYLTLWASVEVYGLIPASVAFVSLIGVSGLGCALALRHGSQTLALLSVIGGFMNPFVTGASAEMPEGLYMYTLAIDLGVVALAFMRPWRILEKVAFVASWIVFEVGDGSATVSFIAATGIFLMFGAAPYARALLRRGQGVTDLAFVPVNGLIYYFAVFVRLTGDLEPYRGPFTLALGVIFLAGFLILRSAGTEDEAFSTSTGVMSFLFLTLWSPVQLGVSLTPLGWAVEALLLFGLALIVKDELMRGAGWIVLIMAGSMLLAFAASDPAGSVADNYGRFAFLTLIAALYVAAFVEQDDLWGGLRDAALVLASLMSLIWLSLEVYSGLSNEGAISPRSADLQFGLSAVWALYAGALLVVGIIFPARSARLVSLILFGVTLTKMAAHDLWLLDTLQRLIGFGGIGALLLACSLLYHRFKAALLASEGRPRT